MSAPRSHRARSHRARSTASADPLRRRGSSGNPTGPTGLTSATGPTRPGTGPGGVARLPLRRRGGDRGQTTVLLAVVVLVAVGAVVLLANLGRVAADRARARTAADAAALAAAAALDPAEAASLARDAAGRNGGVVEAVTVQDGVAEVTVRVGGARATSAAAPTWRAGRTIRPAGVVTAARGSFRSRPFPYTCADALDRSPADPRCGG